MAQEGVKLAESTGWSLGISEIILLINKILLAFFLSEKNSGLNV